jgi:glucose/arabinose dehydrogenase
VVKKFILTVLIVIMGAVGLGGCTSPAAQTTEIPTTTLTSGTSSTNTSTILPDAALATGLEIPWALAFLPDGNIIFTERPGRVRLYESGKGLQATPLMTVPGISAQGESGLLGIAVHPDYAGNHYVYLYYTRDNSGTLVNRVERFTVNGGILQADKIILDNIPAGSIHDGGRIKFGPDGYLYITSGDAGKQDAAQDISALNGKIHRVKDDGGIPPDNPFPGSTVYSYGHRNPEGLAWDDKGRLWATEHGSSATDELNLIEPGKNYGWPVIRGNETGQGMVTPVINSGTDTWAPSGAAFYQGSIYYTGLRGVSLFEAVINGDTVNLKRHLQGAYGRLREVVAGPDGFLYVLTSNRDGRGNPVSGDDKLIRVDPRGLK